MSMPVIPPPDPKLTREMSLNMVIASIAFEETALGNLVDAQSAQLEYMRLLMKKHPERYTMKDFIALNASVKAMVDSIYSNQVVLKKKLDSVLCTQTPCPPPCPPCPPCPAPCCCKAYTTIHKVSPCCYCPGQCIDWRTDDCCRSISANIPPDTNNSYIIDLHLNIESECGQLACFKIVASDGLDTLQSEIYYAQPSGCISSFVVSTRIPVFGCKEHPSLKVINCSPFLVNIPSGSIKLTYEDMQLC